MNRFPNQGHPSNRFQSPKISPRMKHQIQQQTKARMSPLGSRNMGSFSPGHWKRFVANDLINDQNQSRISCTRNTFTQGHSDRFPVYQAQQHIKRKQDVIRRVRQLQEKVFPMIENQNNNQEQDFGWRGRIEQKVLKLQTAVDSLRKDMQIQMERKIMEMESKWQARLQQLYSRMNQQM